MVKCASVFLEEYRASQDHLAVPSVVEKSSRWVPPPGHRFKLNFDAAIFQEIPVSGFGAIIWNERGEVMAHSQLEVHSLLIARRLNYLHAEKH